MIVVVGSTTLLGGTAWFPRKAIYEQKQLEILESGTVEEKQRAADLLIEVESEKSVLFLGRGEIPAPGMRACGVDPMKGELGCELYPSCK